MLDLNCNYGEFQCIESGRCIDASMRCDSRLDCDDGSDEADCDFDDYDDRGDQGSEEAPGDYRYRNT